MKTVWVALAVIGSLVGSLTVGPAAGGSVAPAILPALPHGTTRLATVRHAVTGYAWPGRHAVAKVPATWYGYRSVLPVVAMTPGWVRVRLAQRPDGSMAWIPASDVTLGSTPYAIVIDSKTMHLALYDLGRKVFSAPAGIGAPDDPTPRGQFFVAFVESPPVPNDGYGPFIIVTSAHSNAIKNWEGSGDAVMGIHGPLGEDREIGTSGARISHGCIRLHLSALRRLSAIPPGTPVTVIAG
jgi:lipoprotein-anchoring transpeptidase ErfK/SrfK